MIVDLDQLSLTGYSAVVLSGRAKPLQRLYRFPGTHSRITTAAVNSKSGRVSITCWLMTRIIQYLKIASRVFILLLYIPTRTISPRPRLSAEPSDCALRAPVSNLCPGLNDRTYCPSSSRQPDITPAESCDESIKVPDCIRHQRIGISLISRCPLRTRKRKASDAAPKKLTA